MGRLHAALTRAARGELPSWAEASAERRAHMGRVAELMGRWAEALSLSESDVTRWRAAGYLHDALRDMPPEELRDEVPEELSELPGKILHGPVAAKRLREEGVADEALLRGVAFHTLGHPEMDDLGKALLAADFLEPGRDLENSWRAELRARMPEDLDQVVLEVMNERVEYTRQRLGTVRPESEELLERLRSKSALRE